MYPGEINNDSENIGARRLHTVLTTLLEEILFDPTKGKKKVTISAKMVEKTLEMVEQDLSTCFAL